MNVKKAPKWARKSCCHNTCTPRIDSSVLRPPRRATIPSFGPISTLMLLSLFVSLAVVLPGAFGSGGSGFPGDPAMSTTGRSLRGDVAGGGGGAAGGGGGAAAEASDEETAATKSGGSGSPYVILCDAGSTGTRLYVYRRLSPDEISAGGAADEGRSRNREVDIQVGPKVKPGLSAQTPDSAASYLRPSLLEAAQRMVPPEFHSSTPLVVYATAGMRLLPDDAESDIYDGLAEGLRSDPDVPFVVERTNFRTIPGDDEGYFAALAVNYLAGRVGADLTPKSSSGGIGKPVQEAEILGALDLGGASAQIVFPLGGSGSAATASGTLEERQRRLRSAYVPDRPRPIGRDDFFSASLLGYGADQIRHKMDEFVAEGAAGNAGGEAKEEEVRNPCYFKGYRDTLGGVPQVGTGNAALCLKQVHAVMERNPPENGDDDVPADIRGKTFYAMTLYYYVLDFARDVLGDLDARGESTAAVAGSDSAGDTAVRVADLRSKLSSSHPPVSLLRDAASTVCSWDFEYLSRPDVYAAYDDMTGRDNMPSRCMELTYVTALLERLGLSGDPARTGDVVEFVDTVGGESVEWTLGAFLHLSNGGDDDSSRSSAKSLFHGLQNGDDHRGALFIAAMGGWMLVAYVVARRLRGWKGQACPMKRT